MIDDSEAFRAAEAMVSTEIFWSVLTGEFAGGRLG
jgi:hypothetical protein